MGRAYELFSRASSVGRVVPNPDATPLSEVGAPGFLVTMIGADGAVGLAAAALEQVRAAQRQVGSLIDDVEEVAGRLRASAEIPWSGDAARAWRDRVEGTGRDLARGVDELGELQAALSALLHRIRP